MLLKMPLCRAIVSFIHKTQGAGLWRPLPMAFATGVVATFRKRVNIIAFVICVNARLRMEVQSSP